MHKVLIVLGSDSDLKRISGLTEALDQFAVAWDLEICSAHRTPERAQELAKNAEEEYSVIIAGAGMAAHLPGVLAASSILPIIGVPLAAGALQGKDALYSIVQMPPGIPVATVGIDAGKNAAILAVEILAVSDAKLRSKLHQYRVEQRENIAKKNHSVKEQLKRNG